MAGAIMCCCWLLGESVPPNLALGLILVMAGVAAMTVPSGGYAERINRFRARLKARRPAVGD